MIYKRIFNIQGFVKLTRISVLVFSVFTLGGQSYALPQSEIDAIHNDSVHYVLGGYGNTSSCEGGVALSGNGNKDYAGRDILTKAQLSAIESNRPFYEKAANKVDIPWQMIAVIHVRETGLARENPSNGQGIYQIVSGEGGPYPTGQVSDDEFQRQTNFAAGFIKSKAASNYAPNRTLNKSAAPEVIKDTFFSYNGRASVYEQQAGSIGFDPNTQGYEGSPYVMNKADAKRDPGKNPTGWGQIKRDHGPIEYPANSDYGAFVQYAGLAGVSLGGTCDTTASGPVRQRVVELAKQELELWNNGTLKPGTDYHKYSQGRNENWCADFVSWIYNKAGYPLAETKEGNVPSVDGVKAIGEQNKKFSYHPSSGYTPKPGDLVIQKGPDISHVMIVAAVNGNVMTVIGGNQGGGGGGYTSSKVTQYNITGFTVDSIIGYVSPNGG